MAAPARKTIAPSEIVIPESVNMAQGKQLYNSACMACHTTGAAGAPKLGDKSAWAPRLAQGFEVLVEHSLKGFKGMPAKGGRLDLPDSTVISAVGYMVSKSK
jgi:cytochrome c5